MYFSHKAVVETLGFFAAASPLLLNFHLFPSSHVQFRVVLESSSSGIALPLLYCMMQIVEEFFNLICRTDTVRQLLDSHPELVGPYTAYGGAMYCHTPLHLASRNGHK